MPKEHDPLVNWYGVLLTTTTLVMGTWKFAASYANKDATSVTVVDWILGILLGLIFYWMDRFKQTAWLRWTVRRSAIADVYTCCVAFVELAQLAFGLC
ncbi:hypothetical protein PsYK624_049490 [Phanerochaete sordida]|uniref:Uncharacterized protein n=1 Tax=Phanerochaete sordida TaxID=48140 RepID=A0A9P3G6A5_9APHY|nr:hypothetical protein PsYK624_049490 [Phanerochaete sordida]